MKKTVMALLLSLFVVAPTAAVNAEPLVPKEAAELLTASVVRLTKGCTASKIGDFMYLTAKHCVNSDMRIETQRTNHYPKSVVMAWQKKDGNRKEDWAIINTATDEEAIPSLKLGCDEEVYLGMRVAYAGYPSPTKFAFGMGNVTSLDPSTSRGNDLDYMMDVHAAPGSSGSPVISMDTGNVVGILTEGVMNDRIGAFMVGFESIKNLDLCDTEDEDAMKEANPDTIIDHVYDF